MLSSGRCFETLTNSLVTKPKSKLTGMYICPTYWLKSYLPSMEGTCQNICFSSSPDCWQSEQLRHGSDGGQQRHPGVCRLRQSPACRRLEEGRRQGDRDKQEHDRWEGVVVVVVVVVVSPAIVIPADEYIAHYECLVCRATKDQN